MKSGKYKYFAGGLIMGPAGAFLKQIMKSPRLKETIKKNVTKVKQNYKSVNLPTVSKKLKNYSEKLEIKKNKMIDISNEIFKTQRKKLYPLSDDVKGSNARNNLARSMKAYRRLGDYEKSLNEKFKALVQKNLFKMKEN